MKNVFLSKTPIQVAGLFAVLIVFASWQPGAATAFQNKNLYAQSKDTTAPKTTFSDQADFQLNIDSVMQQVNLALSQIDYARINADVQKQLAEIDYNKINREVNKAIKEIDWNQIKLDVSHSLDSAKAAIDKINWNEMKASMSHAQAEAQKAVALQKVNVDSLKIQIQSSLQQAQKNLQSAKIEFANYKGLLTALQNDGLIEKNKPYKIELKNGILYINDVKQTKAITDKYNKYYSGKQNFTLSDDGGTDL